MGNSHPQHKSPEPQITNVKTFTAYDHIGGKNFEYYNGTRFFKISRKHYTQYTRGYLWGYYEVDE